MGDRPLWLPRPQDMPWIVYDAFNVVYARFSSEYEALRFAEGDPLQESWVANVRDLHMAPRAYVFGDLEPVFAAAGRSEG